MNEKLAKWRWPDVDDLIEVDEEHIFMVWHSKGTNLTIHRFTESLDACFKWLVPKLSFPTILLSSDAECDGTPCWLCELSERDVYDQVTTQVSQWAETPALALCKAIEQLIDKEQP